MGATVLVERHSCRPKGPVTPQGVQCPGQAGWASVMIKSAAV
jgi:hypothetical protein